MLLLVYHYLFSNRVISCSISSPSKAEIVYSSERGGSFTAEKSPLFSGGLGNELNPTINRNPWSDMTTDGVWMKVRCLKVILMSWQ